MSDKDTLTLLRDVEAALQRAEKAIAWMDEVHTPAWVGRQGDSIDATKAAVKQATLTIQELIRRAGAVDDSALIKRMLNACDGLEDLEDCMVAALNEVRPHLAPVASGWMPIENLTGNEYVLLYSAKGFFEPNENYQVGTREQWHKTATHFQHLPQPPKKD